MKKVILWVIFLILLIAVLPITAGIKQDANSEIQDNRPIKKAQNIELNEEETNILINNVMEYITEDADKECKKAVIALCKNNALVQKGKNEKQVTFETSAYSDSFYNEIKSILKDDSINITLKGERVYIPIVSLSPGYIVPSKDYPYISTVACPWDTQNPQYLKDKDYACGISINGIKSLCALGFDSKYVLSYFLPQFSVT